MVYGDLQLFDIVVFAVIAVFIIYRLRGVLGKRTGFQKNLHSKNLKEKNKEELSINNIPTLKENEIKLETIYKSVVDFNHRLFLEGAKKAFEIIITAFNNGDKKALKNLVSKDVFNAFSKAIDDGSNNTKSQFYSLIVDSVEEAKIVDGKILISINFISEQIITDKEEVIIKNKDTWTFEKPIKSNNPAWLLVST